MTDIPVIETERLSLRAPAPRDWEPYCAFILSARARHAGRKESRADAWRAFCVVLAHWTLRGFGMWVLNRKGADAPVGLAGLWFPEGRPEREIGWVLYEGSEGEGYAFEAALAVREHAYGALGWRTLVSYIDPANDRSIALAERLGARRDDAADRPDAHALVYRHPAPEAIR